MRSAIAQKNTDASNNLALVLCEQNDDAKKDRALQYAEDNVRLSNRSPQSLSTYGWVLYRLGRRDAAEQVLTSVAQAGPMSPDLAYYLAQVYSERDRKTDAKNLLEAALKSQVGGRPLGTGQPDAAYRVSAGGSRLHLRDG